MENVKSILVIGSKGHPRATKCIDWGENAYVGDFDVVIVNTRTLTREKLAEISGADTDYFDRIKRHIIDTQINKGIEIDCIISPVILPKVISNYSSDEDAADEIKKLSNYSWCPVIPLFESVPAGQKLDKENSQLSQEYLSNLDKYSLILADSINNTSYYDHNERTGVYTKHHRIGILKNNIGKNVAFTILWRVYRHSDYNLEVDSQKSIRFLPPTSKIEEGINILIDEYLKPPEEEIPEWAKAIDLPGIPEIRKNIEVHLTSIKSAENNIENLNVSLVDLSRYIKLLYSTGNDLENVVEQSFELLGINLIKPDVSNVEDRFYTTEDNKKIYLEIRGVNRLMSENDLAQLIKRVAEKPSSSLMKTRGVFVFNHQNKTEPDKRDKAFHHNIVQQAKSFNLCLIDTQNLLKLVVKKLNGEDMSNLPTTLFNTQGVYTVIDENSN